MPSILPESTTLPPAQRLTVPLAVIFAAVACCAIVTILFCSEMAPALERALPLSLAPSKRLIAPFANIVPWKIEFSPKSTWPFTCQNTLHSDAPFFNIIREFTVLAKAPLILKINMEVGSPCPSKIRSPLMVDAAPMQYTLGNRVWPLPRVVGITSPQVMVLMLS